MVVGGFRLWKWMINDKVLRDCIEWNESNVISVWNEEEEMFVKVMFGMGVEVSKRC